MTIMTIITTILFWWLAVSVPASVLALALFSINPRGSDE